MKHETTYKKNKNKPLVIGTCSLNKCGIEVDMIYLFKYLGLLTLAPSLVLHVQIGVAFAFCLQQCAFVFVGLSVGAADGSFPCDVGAVWRTHAARLASSVHLAPLSWPTVNILAGF